MIRRKPSLLKALPLIFVGIIFCLFLSPAPTPGTAAVGDAPAGGLASSDSQVPTVVSTDKDGYTLWTVDWAKANQAHCFPVDVIRYPFDLGVQDTTRLTNATLKLTFSHTVRDPNVKDPGWSVGLNSNLANGDWKLLPNGILNNHPVWQNPTGTKEVEIPFDAKMLIDGENNVYLKKHDLCPESPGCETCACTCIVLKKVQLRATDFQVVSTSPQNGAKNVVVEDANTLGIRVTFTRPPDPDSLNAHTFQVYYLDEDGEKVFVDGEVYSGSDTDYYFYPDDDLMDGVRYVAQVWGKKDAEAADRDEWVTEKKNGIPLEENKNWSFLTMPDIEVEVVALQVVEDATFIAFKPAVIKTFIRWEKKAGVHEDEQLKKVEVEDINVTWVSSSQSGSATWSGGGAWTPFKNPKTSLRKREYRQITTPDESYTRQQRAVGSDSVNYYGFTPTSSGSYEITSRVLLKDNKGKKHPTIENQTVQVILVKQFGLHMRAVAVGADFANTSPVNLSTTIGESLMGIKDLYPLANVKSPPAPSAMTWYTPSDPSQPWATVPGSGTTKKLLIREMNDLCLRSSGCRVMVGLVSPGWLVDSGLTLTSLFSTSLNSQGALVATDAFGTRRFVAAHEVGHISGFYFHQAVNVDNGHNVRKREDKRYPGVASGNIYDFMHETPYEAGSKEIWISKSSYEYLYNWVRESRMMASQAAAKSTDPLLLVSGLITESTSEVQLSPFYQMEPGEWTAPDPGPYKLVFLDAADQEIIAYTRSFSGSNVLLAAGPDIQAGGGAIHFSFSVPYPATMAKIQIRKDAAVLKEIVPAASAPVVNINPPSDGTWSGTQSLAWTSDPGTRYFAVDVSTDNGENWECLAINQTGTSFSLQTASLPDTSQALVRVAATDGLRTGTDTVGPFTIDNPPVVTTVSPAADAVDVNLNHPVYIGFRDDMDPTTINETTITMSGGPYGAVSGAVVYDAEDREAAFTPRVPLAYSTTYTVKVRTGVKDAKGQALPTATTWSFTTAADYSPPEPVILSPEEGALDAPLDAVLLAVWDEAINPATLDAGAFTLATAGGGSVSGAVAYDAASRTASFTPAANMVPDIRYIATLKAGIEDSLGNATEGDYSWAFTTSSDIGSDLAFSGAFSDQGLDSDGDGVYETLSIQVGVQVKETGDYELHGTLLDPDGMEVASGKASASLAPGAHVINLHFDGANIGGRAVDGPYTLTELTLSKSDASVGLMDAYSTYAYKADQFLALLHFSGLPDQVILPGTMSAAAFNVRDYAQHATLPSDGLTYTLAANTAVQIGVAIQPSGDVDLTLEAGWLGSAQVTIQASDGVTTVRDSFQVTVGWPVTRYLPVLLRGSSGVLAPAARETWRSALFDDAETDQYWKTYSRISNPPGGFYSWARRDCSAYSGDLSFWPFGGESTSAPACGAVYPNTLSARMCTPVAMNLKYTSQAELRAKIWTDIAPGDRLCLRARAVPEGITECWYADPWFVSDYQGICQTGTTDGWEDMVVDLANVPGLGSLLGEEAIWVQLEFETDSSEARPVGAYIDDIQVRLCPQGLDCESSSTSANTLSTSAAEIPTDASTPIRVDANIGGYTEQIHEMSLAVEDNGRLHALWTGTLNPHFNRYVFYSTSTDGINWTPYQILNYWVGYDPKVVVDNTHQRAHLIYRSNYDGVIHHTVEGGVVSKPVVVAPGVYPDIAVDETSGYLYAVWQEGHSYRIGDTTNWRYRTWHAYWDGTAWSAPIHVINDDDTWDSSVAVAVDGGVMLAWFQRWSQSLGGPSDPGEATIPRTAYGATPGGLPLRQGVSPEYPLPEKDNSILFTYSGGDDAFVLTSSHLMWPGHSRVYRYLWKDGLWSAPLDIAGNSSGWGVPIYVGAAADNSLVTYVYNEGSTLKIRSETNGQLGAVLTVVDYLAARGYGSPSVSAYFVDRSGGLHMLVSAVKSGVAGYYYVRP